MAFRPSVVLFFFPSFLLQGKACQGLTFLDGCSDCILLWQLRIRGKVEKGRGGQELAM